ncbi:MAG: diacylglycerol kinase family lipid kinase [Xanthomonadales bacterium]|nr:diacylglycerol kinase family lipid kinase [Xanthomonadales bacterium]
MSSTAVAIINPASGKTRSVLDELAGGLRNTLDSVEIQHTESQDHATELAAEALDRGAEMIIAVGGDGTVSEVVNGFFDVDGNPRNPEAALGVVMSGTGGDFRRCHPIPATTRNQLRILGRGRTCPIDIGLVTYLDHAGREARRYFSNSASMGLSGRVCDYVNRHTLTKRLGGRIAFHLAAVRSLIGYRNAQVTLQAEDADIDQSVAVNTVAIMNGPFFGGGMQVAPDAQTRDGVLDVVVLGDFGFWEAVRSMPMIYDGSHVGHEKVSRFRSRRIRAAPIDDSEVLLEIDGEGPGRLPAEFRVLPGAINLVIGREDETRGP